MGKLDKFDHLVVVMFENRSLDSVLGYLYEPGTVPRGQSFNGLAGKDFANPVPDYIKDGHPEVKVGRSAGTHACMSNPNPDPGEEFPHVNTQLFNTVNPATNGFRATANMATPWNAPDPGQQATMQGFVHDYCNNWVEANNKVTDGSAPLKMPTYEQYRIIMDCFGPESLPVLNTLAREFAVFDDWHCAVPSQTFPNRSFFHASTSSGYVVNEPYQKWLENGAETIFNRLNDAKLSWKVYYDHTQPMSLTALIHFPKLRDYWLTHFATMETFYEDVKNGKLPAYAFVEPRLFYRHNDYHPPAPLFSGLPLGATSDVRDGEMLLHEIYSAVRVSASEEGSNALNTLLLVTFDEHGGNFDHVAPPVAIPPVAGAKSPGEMGFWFDRLGVRVPAIAISAYTQANTVVNWPMHHAAVIRTLCEKHKMPFLTERDKMAGDLSNAINLDEPRDPKTWPVTMPRPIAVRDANAEGVADTS